MCGVPWFVQVSRNSFGLCAAVCFRSTIEDIAEQVHSIVASYDEMMSAYGTQKQRILRCVGFQALNKLSRFALPDEGRTPRAARLDTFEQITQHHTTQTTTSSQSPDGHNNSSSDGDDEQGFRQLKEFLERYSHFGQGLLALEKFGMFRNHPSRVALSGEPELEPTAELLVDAVTEEFEGDLGLQICIGEVVDGLVELSEKLEEELFVET